MSFTVYLKVKRYMRKLKCKTTKMLAIKNDICIKVVVPFDKRQRVK